MARSKIEWTEKVWNPVRGCAPVSEGCRHCYAARFAHRFSADGQLYEGLTRMTDHGPVWTGEVREVREFLNKPLRWKRPYRIFVNSMSDLFHPEVSPVFVDQVLEIMMACPQHIFQVLTKRPERLEEKLYGEDGGLIRALGGGDYVPNLWLGTSVEDQAALDKRLPELMSIPAAVRWLSMEPLLGPVEIPTEFLTGEYAVEDHGGAMMEAMGPRLDWVVVGGESGPNARPMDPAWVRAIRDQCDEFGVPFLFKQWGEWGPVEGELTTKHVEGLHYQPGTRELKVLDDQGQAHTYYRLEEGWMEWLGKHAAGRELDGKIWDEYPAR